MSEDNVEITVDTTRFDDTMAGVQAGLIELASQRLVCHCCLGSW